MYDLIIVGGGPAGMSAAIYAARYRLKTLVISKEFGGAMAEAHRIENYPGHREIAGVQLAQEMRAQVEKLGAEIKEEEVQRIENGDQITVNQKHKCRYLLLALGTQRRKLNLPEEERFIGKGVSYCAACDAPFFKDKIVGVIGGRDAACMAADHLTQYAKEVHIIYRGEKLRAQPFVCEKTEKNPKIDFMFKKNVTELIGAEFLEAVRLSDGREAKMDGLFVEIGGTPSSVLFKDLGVAMDKEGYVKVDSHQKTNIERIYSAGDITPASNKWRQIITGCAEGAIAVHSIYGAIYQDEGRS
jgi:thioredoxin reductase (NADPH)